MQQNLIGYLGISWSIHPWELQCRSHVKHQYNSFVCCNDLVLW